MPPTDANIHSTGPDQLAPTAAKDTKTHAQAQPTRAILASTLLPPGFSFSQKDEEWESSSSRPQGKWPRQKVPTGWGREVDEDVLGGGLEGIVSVAVHKREGEGDVASELLYATITTNLLSHLQACVFVITTPNSFSPIRLYKQLSERLRKTFNDSSASPVGRQQDEGVSISIDEESRRDVANIDERAKSAMRRVQVMRVFDLEGCLEAVLETGKCLRHNGGHYATAGVDYSSSQARKETNEKQRSHDTHDSGLAQEEHEAHGAGSHENFAMESGYQHQDRALPDEIADSQAPSAISSSDDEMLPDALPNASAEKPPPLPQRLQPDCKDTPAAALHKPSTANSPTEHQDEDAASEIATKTPPAAAAALIVLPTLPHLAAAQMRRNHVRGHAILVQLLRNIHLLCSSPLPAYPPPNAASIPVPLNPHREPATRQSARACLILNSTVGGEASWRAQNGRNDAGAEARAAGPSAFAANAGIRPALGKTFGFLVDMSLLVTSFSAQSTVAAGAVAAGNAELDSASARRGGGGGDKMRARETVHVVEVLLDKHGNRGGRWGVLR